MLDGLRVGATPSRSAAQPGIADQAAKARNPEGDRVVDDDRGGGLGGGRSVEDERSGEAGFEDAEAAGHREHVGQVADDVAEDEDVDGDRVSGGGEGGTESGDVTAEIGDGAQQAPV